jgi:hypothetical protein
MFSERARDSHVPWAFDVLVGGGGRMACGSSEAGQLAKSLDRPARMVRGSRMVENRAAPTTGEGLGGGYGATGGGHPTLFTPMQRSMLPTEHLVSEFQLRLPWTARSVDKSKRATWQRSWGTELRQRRRRGSVAATAQPAVDIQHSLLRFSV